MSLHTSFGIGGPAEAFARPEDAAAAVELAAAAKRKGIPLFVLGGGANVLVGDRGVRGIVMDCARLAWTRMEEGFLAAGAGLSMESCCLEALAKGLGGLEDFAGMPGSVGGAVFMNARCYGAEMSSVLEWVASADEEGRVTRRPVAAVAAPAVAAPAVAAPAVAASAAPASTAASEARVLSVAKEWSYKRSPYQQGGEAAGELILEAAFRLEPADDAAVTRIARVMRERRADREVKGHYRLPSAGSVFKNDRGFGAPTGVLLDRLGLRGKRIGDAMVSPWHANIFVNAGDATASDMRELIELAQREARASLGVDLEPEILMVGEF